MAAHVRQRKYETLATKLRDQIRKGAFKPGDRLPTLTELNLSSGLTSPTILRAHTLLEQEGWITRRRGHGTFVADNVPQKAVAGSLTETVVVLTPYGKMPALDARAPGWAFFTTAGILEELHDVGCNAIMLHPDKTKNRDVDIEWLANQHPFGVIMDDNYSSDLERLRLLTDAFTRAGVPIVALGDMPFWADHDRIASDHEQGVYEQTQWLIAHGCRRILPINPPFPHIDWPLKRLAGYRRAMEEAGLDPIPAVISPFLPPHTDTQEQFMRDSRHCAASLIEVMTGPLPCDALMIASDGPLLYYAAACRIFGKEPNRDILLAGYDNYWQETSERQWETATPDVTVDKDNQRIGKELVRLLRDRINGACPTSPQLRLVPPILVPVTGNTIE